MKIIGNLVTWIKQNSMDHYEYQIIKYAKDSSFPFTLLKHLNAQRNDGMLCDIHLIAQNSVFPVHKCVLCAASSYWKAMFSGNFAESISSKVVINDIDPDSLEKILDFIYTGELKICIKTCDNLIAALHLLNMTSVLIKASLVLMRYIAPWNCIKYFQLAELYGLPQLKTVAFACLCSYFVEAMHFPEFLEVSATHLKSFFHSKLLSIDSDRVVFEALVMWYNHRPKERQKDFIEILKTVKFPLISREYLILVVQNNPAMKLNQECLDLIEEAKQYHLLPALRTQNYRCKPRPYNDRSVANKVLMKIVVNPDLGVEVYAWGSKSVEFYRIPSIIPATMKEFLLKPGKFSLSTDNSGTRTIIFNENLSYSPLWCYYSLCNVWGFIGSLTNPCEVHCLVVESHCLYAVRETKDGCSLEQFDQTQKSWTHLTSIDDGFTNLSVVFLNESLYFIGEKPESFVIKQYNTVTGLWSTNVSEPLERKDEIIPSVRVVINPLSACKRENKICISHNGKLIIFDPQLNLIDNEASKIVTEEYSALLQLGPPNRMFSFNTKLCFIYQFDKNVSVHRIKEGNLSHLYVGDCCQTTVYISSLKVLKDSACQQLLL